MDATQPPSPPEESTDIFSLPDDALSDSLQFIEEARSTFLRYNPHLTLFLRLALEIGAAFGYAIQSPVQKRAGMDWAKC